MIEHSNLPKHVEFYSKNKFEKLVHLVGFIIRMDWDLIITVLLTYWKFSFLQFKLYIIYYAENCAYEAR